MKPIWQYDAANWQENGFVSAPIQFSFKYPLRSVSLTIETLSSVSNKEILFMTLLKTFKWSKSTSDI